MNLKRFVTELKRRNVYRVAVAYVVVAWLLIQVATQTFPFFDIPNWAVRLVILLLIIGFPVALILAWAFELTPEGVKRTEGVPREQSIVRSTRRKLDFVIITVLALAVTLLLFDRFRPRSAHETSGTAENSIAVLPFENASGNTDTEYLSEG
ncbi:MAG TPA: hypothetical protein VGP40_05285, partial [Chthoniobacterales bacterium]|nr:hypothetical protein [Chthoniobacterales bacterium]